LLLLLLLLLLLFNRYQFSQKLIKVKCFIDNNVCSVLNCDKIQIEHVINNFLSNSIKFSNIESTIEIFATYGNKLPKHVTFLVKDNGIGILEEDKQDL
jgi:signal transduction histidine kinase